MSASVTMESSNERLSEGRRPSASISSAGKRKRSPCDDQHAQTVPPTKTIKTQPNHLQINYLVRQYSDDLPLVSGEDNLQTILTLIGEYDGVLQRHESMAVNMGARPLGPILIKRFERLFDGPPKVLKSHGKDGIAVTWLDVVEFARSKPEQFTLGQMRDGVRVCQFYTKQSRVEISEEDYVLISSGMPQKLIPPQPITEDEEKELGTLEILEKNLSHIVQLADQVSARARQLNHRLKNRKIAIMSRRTNEALNNGRNPARSVSPPAPGRSNGHSAGVTSRRSHTPPSGFVAVNTRRLSNLDDISHGSDMAHAEATSGASPATHAELLTKFLATRGRSIGNPEVDHRRSSFSSRLSIDPAPVTSTSALPSKGFDASEYATVLLNSASPVPLSATPPALPPPPRPVVERDDGGPFKVEMVARMEHLARGDRIIPPCDRCRRLHMDCLKNLTACTGCTKKHAKCSWKDVQEEELTGDGEEEPHEGSNSEAHEDGQDEPGEARDTSVGLTSSGAVQEADKEPGEEGALGESKGNEEVHHGNGNTISNGDSKAKK